MSFRLDAAGAVYVKIKADSDDLVNKTKVVTEVFSNFSYKVSEELNDVKENVEKVEETVSSFLKNIFSLELAKQAFEFLSDAVLNFGAEMSALSAKTGFAVGELSSWSLAAQNAGTSVEGLANAARNVNLESFSELGLSMSDVGLPIEERFKKVVDALQAIESPTERARLATLAFGDSVSELGTLLDLGTGSFDESIEKAEKFGLVMDEDAAETSRSFKESLNALKLAAGSFGIELGSVVLPAVTYTLSVLTNYAGAFKRLVSEHKLMTKGIIALIGAFAAFSSINSVVSIVREAKMAFVAWCSAMKANAVTLQGLITKNIAFTASANASAGASKTLAAALGVARGAMLATSAAMGGLAIAAGVYMLIKAISEAKRYTAELSDEMSKLYESGNQLRQLGQTKFEFIEGIANQGTLANDTFKKGAKFVQELQERYGDLGIVVDETTQSITLAAGAQDKFNAAIRAEAAEQLKKQIAEEEKNLAELEKENQGNFDYYNSLGGKFEANYRAIGSKLTGGKIRSADVAWSKETEEMGEKLNAQRQKLFELRKKMNEIENGDTDAAFGKTDEDVANEAAGAVTEDASKKIADLDAQLAAIETKSRRASQTRVQNAIEDARKEEEAYVDALKARLELEKAKPEVEQNTELIASLQSKIDGSGARIFDAESKIKGEEYGKLLEQIEQTEGRISGVKESETERRIREIDRETEAYKKLLEAALAVADTDEKRAELQGKLDGIDANAQQRKADILAESQKNLPSEELAKMQNELANVFQNAARDGQFSQREMIEIYAKQQALAAKEQKEKQAEVMQASKEASERLAKASDALAQAKESGDYAAIAKASDEYRSAYEALASCTSQIQDFATTEFGQDQDVVNAINESSDDSTKEFLSCITMNNADAIQNSLKASYGVMSKIETGNNFARNTAVATDNIDNTTNKILNILDNRLVRNNNAGGNVNNPAQFG